MSTRARQTNVGIIGLDTSHSIQFAKRMQAPDCPAAEKVEGMRAVSCLRFETPFQDRKGLDERQAQLEAWGVRVTEDLEEAVRGTDALMLEVNDPSLHVEYFRRCATLGKPIFLDKPLADTAAHGREIVDTARSSGTRFFSASSLRFVPALLDACAAVPGAVLCSAYGPLGKAPAGSSIVWYGVHAFEMMELSLGRGARRLLTRPDKLGVVVMVEYGDARRGIVELTENAWSYGGVLRTLEQARPFVVDMSTAYTDLLKQVYQFFVGGEQPVAVEDTVEVMGLLDAAERSLRSGAPVDIST